MNTIKVKLIFKSGDRHITEIMGDPQQNVHDAFVADLNQIYENVRLVCEQVDFEFEVYCNLWPLLYNYWSELKELSLNLGEVGDQQIVVFDIFRDVDIQRRELNETWVYCVTNPIDWGRIISIQGPVEEERTVFLSSSSIRSGHVRHFETPIRGMNGNQAWVTANSNTIYFMDPITYEFNTQRMNNPDMRQTASTLGLGLLALKNEVQALKLWAQQYADQSLQHYYAQNQGVIQNVEPTHEDEDDDLLDEILEGQGGQNQEDIQDLVNSLDIDQNTVVNAPVQVNVCLDNCNQRIEKSYQQIEQLLQEVYQLCEKRNRIEREMPHAVNIVLDGTGHLFLPRKPYKDQREIGVNETMVDLQLNFDYNFETQGLTQFVRTVCYQVDNQLANRGYLIMWQTLHEQWSKLQIFQVDLSRTGDVTPFVYKNKVKHLRIEKKKDHILVLCVTQPHVDSGRILYIEGEDPTHPRPVSLSIANRNVVQRFDRNALKNIEDGPVVVNGNTLYLMDKAIRIKNGRLIHERDLLDKAKTLRNVLPLLIDKLQDLNNICEQIEQHFEAQNEQGILMATGDALLVIDGCRARIQQSLQPIDQILDLLLLLCQKRDTIDEQTAGAVNCLLPTNQNLLDKRKGIKLDKNIVRPDLGVVPIDFPEEEIPVIQNAGQNQILENMDTHITEIMVNLQQNVYNFETQGLNGLTEYVYTGCYQVDKQFTK